LPIRLFGLDTFNIPGIAVEACPLAQGTGFRDGEGLVLMLASE
jgi:hypothetical protein